jgi:hypothetical protein
MYCLELFYRHGSRIKERDYDETRLLGVAKDAVESGLITCYRLVHIEAGKCVDLWKENDNVK